MNNKTIIKKSIHGGFIVFTSSALRYLFAFGTQVYLARILEPDYFGALAFATMVAMFFNNFTNTNGDKYIIKERENTYQKIDNVFTLEILLSVIFSILVIGIAPLLMKLLGKPELINFVQFLALLFFYNAFSKPRSLFERELSFYRSKLPGVVAQLSGGIVGITLAYLEYGIWSLLLWRFTTLYVEVLIIWLITPYRPKLVWDSNIMIDIISFGWPLLGSSLLVFFYWNIDYYLVGRFLGDVQLGYYWLAFQTSQYFLKVKASIISVVFPTFSRMGNENDIKIGFEILTKLTAIMYMFPTIIVLILGEDLIQLIFGDNWAPATTAFQIFMVLAAIRAITSYWDPVFWYYGKTKLLFSIAALNSVFVAGFGYFVVRVYGIEGMALVVLFSIILITPIAASYLKKLINTSYFKIVFEPIFTAFIIVIFLKLSITYLFMSGEFQFTQKIILIFLFSFSYGAINYIKNKHIIRKLLSTYG